MPRSSGPQDFRERARRLRAGTVIGLANQLGTLVRLYGGTDKWIHGYTPYYETHLGPLRLRRLVVFEIGVGGYKSTQPGGSLAIWRDFFPRATIVGIDIEEKHVNLGPRVSFMRADQASHSDLDSLVKTHGAPNVVIDDGSHVGEHIWASFAHLWPLMPPGSVYVIEDLSTSYYPSFGGDNPPPRTSAVGLLAELADSVQAMDSTFTRKPHWGSRSKPAFADAAALHVYPGIAFIVKS